MVTQRYISTLPKNRGNAFFIADFSISRFADANSPTWVAFRKISKHSRQSWKHSC